MPKRVLVTVWKKQRVDPILDGPNANNLNPEEVFRKQLSTLYWRFYLALFLAIYIVF